MKFICLFIFLLTFVGCEFSMTQNADTKGPSKITDTNETKDDKIAKSKKGKSFTVSLVGNEVRVMSSVPLAGFQFNIKNNKIISASGGVAQEKGYVVSTGPTTAVGLHMQGGIIPAGEYTLTQLNFSNSSDRTCLSGIVLSDPKGLSIDYTNNSSCIDN